MKKTSLIILIFLLLSTMSYSYANNERLSSINNINVIRSIDSITINWDLVNNVDYYRIVNEEGVIVYEGNIINWIRLIVDLWFEVPNYKW